MGGKKQDLISSQAKGKLKLSICVPTHNRAEYLHKTLSNLVAIETFQFDYEIIVSDDCSTDETPSVAAAFRKKCDRIRHVKQTRNVGAEANLISAFRIARGELVVYLPDDGILIPDAVVAVVQYMDRMQRVVACYTPWEYWNDAKGEPSGLSFSIDRETVFEKADSINLFNFVMQGHILPESAIYRSNALHSILFRPHKAYWPLVCLAKLPDYGAIAFQSYPFCRIDSAHREDEAGGHFAHGQTMQDLELIRSGIERFLYKAFRNLGHATVPVEQRAPVLKMIGEHIANRFAIALRHLAAEKDFISANELLWRLLMYGTISASDGEGYRRFLPPRAAAQSLIETFDAIASVESIGLYSVSDHKIVLSLLKGIREDLPVEVLSDDAISRMKNKDGVLVLVGNNAAREKLLQAGFKSGLVIVESNLVSQFVA
jgi:glycosyltransferase involved in cell wall biosynthesis